MKLITVNELFGIQYSFEHNYLSFGDDSSVEGVTTKLDNIDAIIHENADRERESLIDDNNYNLDILTNKFTGYIKCFGIIEFLKIIKSPNLHCVGKQR